MYSILAYTKCRHNYILSSCSTYTSSTDAAISEKPLRGPSGPIVYSRKGRARAEIGNSWNPERKDEEAIWSTLMCPNIPSYVPQLGSNNPSRKKRNTDGPTKHHCIRLYCDCVWLSSACVCACDPFNFGEQRRCGQWKEQQQQQQRSRASRLTACMALLGIMLAWQVR